MQGKLKPIDGCWNGDAIKRYVDKIEGQEARLRGDSSVTITSGVVACSGCVDNQFGKGMFCTAQLTETQLTLDGQRPPCEQDAFANMDQVPGFKLIKPGSGEWGEGYIKPEPVAVDDAAPVRQATTFKARFLRRIFRP